MLRQVFEPGWYLAYTKPRHEKRISDCLCEIGIQYFLPTVKTLRNWSGRKKYVDMPLFPSYIFTYLQEASDYFNGLNIDSVLYYVRSGKNLARVQDTVVENIRLMVNEGNDIEVSGSEFKPGLKLVIGEGPLTGLSCEVVETRGGKKILVRIHLMQRNLLMSVPSESLLVTPV